MSRFLKLSNYLLNINDIHRINIYPNKYYVQVITKQIIGTDVKIYGVGSGVGYGYGNVNSFTYDVEVCKKTNSEDYHTLTDWINSKP